MNYFFQIWNLHVALLGGFGSMRPLENLSKWSNLVRFDVYLDQIFSLKFLKNYLFYIKFLKNTIFYIKNRYFTYMLAMG